MNIDLTPALYPSDKCKLYHSGSYLKLTIYTIRSSIFDTGKLFLYFFYIIIIFLSLLLSYLIYFFYIIIIIIMYYYTNILQIN